MTHPGTDPGKALRDRASMQRARGTATELCCVCHVPVGLNHGSVVRHVSPHTGDWCAGRGRMDLSGRAVQPIEGDDEVSARRRGDYARRVALPRALRFVEVVHEEHRSGIGAFMAALSRDEIEAVMVVLAALVPEDVPVARLLAWTDAWDDNGRSVHPRDDRERAAA